MQIEIKRRVPARNVDNRAIPGKFKEVVETTTLVSKTSKGCYVALSNGDVIFRKNRDVVGKSEGSNEQ